mgnify:CR=1 FL=1
MAWKQTGQLSLADSLINAHKAIEELDELHNLIDWQTIEQTLRHVHSSERGESAFHPVIMFKVLLLQKLYNYRIQPWKNNWHETYYFVALLAYH